MPTISVYIPERIYWKLSQIAFKEDLTVARTIALIVESYFLQLEGKEPKTWQEENTESSTRAT